jgi:hypothetical protein
VRQIIGSSGPVYSSRTLSVVAPSPCGDSTKVRTPLNRPSGIPPDQVIRWPAYLWHIVGDRSDATEVEISFTGAGERTTVRIVHAGWERLSAAGPEMRRRNRQGWAGLLDHYRQAAVSR